VKFKIGAKGTGPGHQLHQVDLCTEPLIKHPEQGLGAGWVFPFGGHGVSGRGLQRVPLLTCIIAPDGYRPSRRHKAGRSRSEGTLLSATASPSESEAEAGNRPKMHGNAI
jgi:hypothetical protein